MEGAAHWIIPGQDTVSASRYEIRMGHHDHAVSIDDTNAVTLDGVPVDADIRPIDGTSYSVVLHGISYLFRLQSSGGRYDVVIDGTPATVTVDNARTRLLRQYTSAAAQSTAVTVISAPMPALVVRVLAAAGDAVVQGQGLVVLEAMKMENEIKAPRAGIVKQIHVPAGKAVEKGEILVTLE